MAGVEDQAALFAPLTGSEDARAINDRCQVRTADGHRVVIVAGVPLAQFAVDDRMAEAHAMVLLVEQNWADQKAVAAAFGRSVRTVRRLQRRFEDGGLAALGRASGYPKGRPRMVASRTRRVLRWKEQGLSNRDIAQRLGVSEKSIRKVLLRAGWKPPVARQEPLPLVLEGADPNLSASALVPRKTGNPVADEPRPLTFDRDPSDRHMDRLFACLGLIEDAAPLFASAHDVPRAGVLLAIPALVESGLLDVAEKTYGSLGPSFYGLRTTLVTLVLMALLRIKRPEALKEYAPAELGRLIGLDRAPEVKTLRRKLARLAGFGRAADLGRALALQRVQARGSALGFLYVDGHVRVYHGRHELPCAHVARMRLALPATTDYWVNDAHGEPLFVVTAEANAGMVKMLPQILAETRHLVGERRVTVVFDRGGFSPRLFQRLIAEGFDLLTYRKGRCPAVPRRAFVDHAATIDGRTVSYRLADRGAHFLGGALRLRQVTRLSDDGQHQTPILTSRRDLPAAEVAFRMFERWRQENFFKYLREEYALDALTSYAVEQADPARDVPNPARRALDAKLRDARADVLRLRAEFGRRAADNPEALRRTMRGFKIAHGALGREIRAAEKKIAALEQKRAGLPARVAVADATCGPVVQLAPERQLLTNILKMIAYQVESDLVSRIAPHYKRAEDEGRTLIHIAFQSAADIEVGDDRLTIRLAPLSSPHRSRALAALCDELNSSRATFPGTALRLTYAVRGPR
jgi:transposase